MSGAGAIVLAAGLARRFGGNKLDAPLDGQPLLRHAVAAACAAPVHRIAVVCRPEQALGLADPRLVRVGLASDGLATSLKAGLAALAGCDRAFVFLGDMPRVPHDLAGRLLAIAGDAYAVVPRQSGRPGHPVLLSARAMADAAALSGDAGMGAWLRQRGDVAFLDEAGDGAVRDVDTPEDLARLA